MRVSDYVADALRDAGCSWFGLPHAGYVRGTAYISGHSDKFESVARQALQRYAKREGISEQDAVIAFNRETRHATDPVWTGANEYSVLHFLVSRLGRKLFDDGFTQEYTDAQAQKVGEMLGVSPTAVRHAAELSREYGGWMSLDKLHPLNWSVTRDGRGTPTTTIGGVALRGFDAENSKTIPGLMVPSALRVLERTVDFDSRFDSSTGEVTWRDSDGEQVYDGSQALVMTKRGPKLVPNAQMNFEVVPDYPSMYLTVFTYAREGVSDVEDVITEVVEGLVSEDAFANTICDREELDYINIISRTLIGR